jgi:hypothetical protein
LCPPAISRSKDGMPKLLEPMKTMRMQTRCSQTLIEINIDEKAKSSQ